MTQELGCSLGRFALVTLGLERVLGTTKIVWRRMCGQVTRRGDKSPVVDACLTVSVTQFLEMALVFGWKESHGGGRIDLAVAQT